MAERGGLLSLTGGAYACAGKERNYASSRSRLFAHRNANRHGDRFCVTAGGRSFPSGATARVLSQTQQQALENELWQRVYALAKHLQRAGYCAGHCHGQALVITDGGQCVIVRWDGNSNGIWDLAPEADADSTGFRLRDGALETRRGVADCGGKNWEKMTNPAALTVTRFHVERQAISGFSPELIVTPGRRRNRTRVFPPRRNIG